MAPVPPRDDVPVVPPPSSSRPALSSAHPSQPESSARAAQGSSEDIPIGQQSSSPSSSSSSSSGVSTAQPSVPVEQIIQQFAQGEARFRSERDHFTYVQDFTVQTIDDNGNPDGEYRMTTDITFTPEGHRYEQITYAPVPTLERIMLSEQDLDDLRNIQPFVLTPDELPKYNITYVGREHIDELGTYVFDVAPKVIEKNQRYFQGRIWVEDQDLEIVKTKGKAVPDIHKGGEENLFPEFETYRENIEGHYWFPTYTHADDVLHFKTGDVHIRMTVRYTDYRRFGVSVRLLSPTKQNQQNPPNQQK